MHCFFFVIEEHESVIIIGLKVNHFLCDVEKMQIDHLSSDAVLLMLLFLTCSFTELEEKSTG